MTDLIVREVREEDAEELWRIRRIAFGGPREPEPRPGGNPYWPPEGFRGWWGLVAELDGRPAGFLRSRDYRQFFGGRPVPMGGLASVAVDPYARGRGVASALLDRALAGLREAGQVISALYPSAPPLYRGRGWEQTGVYERMILPLDLLATLPKPTAHRTIRPARPADLPALHDRYLAFASTVDGMLDRATAAFQLDEILELDIVDLVPGVDGIRGYLTAERPEGERLIVYDLIADDVDTAGKLLRSLASWAGVLADVSLRVVDPAVRDLLLSQPVLHDVRNHPWMLRVVDLPAAVAARGWPLTALMRPLSVDLEVIDEHAPWQAGRHRIVFDGDAVFCEPGGSGAVRLHTRALGPWYAGSADSAMLRRAGLLEGDLKAAALLDALTGAPHPVRMADSF
ncbi:MAG TPA: GNAT family N-acetyltransferase [Actinophytocola sp.]|uniref:GNAT family N-acetyltransferase n=1 Tax=Actinophytocola sp. TaxID=1872138 RepID=UPI002DDD4182|nr:GNAT family N-acetyltransferase [Actinophytocola sp.]HEV2778740.1 GNAT family N-acetyltransferase [Actinophytocola sp.]